MKLLKAFEKFFKSLQKVTKSFFSSFLKAYFELLLKSKLNYIKV